MPKSRDCTATIWVHLLNIRCMLPCLCLARTSNTFDLRVVDMTCDPDSRDPHRMKNEGTGRGHSRRYGTVPYGIQLGFGASVRRSNTYKMPTPSYPIYLRMSYSKRPRYPNVPSSRSCFGTNNPTVVTTDLYPTCQLSPKALTIPHPSFASRNLYRLELNLWNAGRINTVSPDCCSPPPRR